MQKIFIVLLAVFFYQVVDNDACASKRALPHDCQEGASAPIPKAQTQEKKIFLFNRTLTLQDAESPVSSNSWTFPNDFPKWQNINYLASQYRNSRQTGTKTFEEHHDSKESREFLQKLYYASEDIFIIDSTSSLRDCEKIIDIYEHDIYKHSVFFTPNPLNVDPHPHPEFLQMHRDLQTRWHDIPTSCNLRQYLNEHYETVIPRLNSCVDKPTFRSYVAFLGLDDTEKNLLRYLTRFLSLYVVESVDLSQRCIWQLDYQFLQKINKYPHCATWEAAFCLRKSILPGELHDIILEHLFYKAFPNDLLQECQENDTFFSTLRKNKDELNDPTRARTVRLNLIHIFDERRSLYIDYMKNLQEFLSRT
jgi:hypothetical protein